MTEKFVIALVGLVIISMAFSAGALWTVYTYEPEAVAGQHVHKKALATYENFETWEDTIGEIAQAVDDVQEKLNGEIESREDIEQKVDSALGDFRRQIGTTVPLGSTPLDTGSAGTGITSPGLTISLDNDVYFLGETITIEGTANPKVSVEAYITRSDLKLQGGFTDSDVNGKYFIAYWIHSDYPTGTYQVKVKSDNEFSELLTFTVK